LRDFEIFDEEGVLCVSASSKWTPVDAVEKKLLRVTEELLATYGTEEKQAFENGELLRLREPKNYLYEMPYHIRRKEIDLNGHLHNLCYLDIALEALPDDVYHSRDFKDIRITYRKEIKADEKDITCKYTEENGTHIVGIYGNNGTLRAIVALS
jgi:acyl-ACP thioesterase